MAFPMQKMTHGLAPAAPERFSSSPYLPYNWERPTRGLPPVNAVRSGRMLVVRAADGTGDVGKFILDEHTAKIPRNGAELTIDDFEFLTCDLHYEWLEAELCATLPPPSCVWASKRMCVCRECDDPEQSPGKYIVDERAAKVPRWGKEVTVRRFEMLVVCTPGLFQEVD